jgi:hypothetical protein
VAIDAVDIAFIPGVRFDEEGVDDDDDLDEDSDAVKQS